MANVIEISSWVRSITDGGHLPGPGAWAPGNHTFTVFKFDDGTSYSLSGFAPRPDSENKSDRMVVEYKKFDKKNREHPDYVGEPPDYIGNATIGFSFGRKILASKALGYSQEELNRRADVMIAAGLSVDGQYKYIAMSVIPGVTQNSNSLTGFVQSIGEFKPTVPPTAFGVPFTPGFNNTLRADPYLYSPLEPDQRRTPSVSVPWGPLAPYMRFEPKPTVGDKTDLGDDVIDPGIDVIEGGIGQDTSLGATDPSDTLNHPYRSIAAAIERSWASGLFYAEARKKAARKNARRDAGVNGEEPESQSPTALSASILAMEWAYTGREVDALTKRIEADLTTPPPGVPDPRMPHSIRLSADALPRDTGLD